MWRVAPLPQARGYNRGLPTMSPTYAPRAPRGSTARLLRLAPSASRLALGLMLLGLLLYARPFGWLRGSQEAAKTAFIKGCPAYGYPNSAGRPRIDELYRKELSPRLRWDEHYLDFTGTSLYWNSQLDAAFKELRATSLGNPHTSNPPSAHTQRRVDEMRDVLLRFLGADPAEYQLVFTRSATAALHMLGEMFPWSKASAFAYLTSNHNSVLGIREYAKQAGAAFGGLEEADIQAWLQDDQPLPQPLQQQREDSAARPAYHLFAYPAMDNYAGVIYPAEWVQAVQRKSAGNVQWKVLLDTAAFAASHPVNLTAVPADFAVFSFYKLFGWPTGLGALVLRADAMPLLHKRFWGGGSAFLAASRLDWRHLSEGAGAFQDGTMNFLDVVAVRHGMDVVAGLGGMPAIREHVDCLADWLYDQLAALQHSNGRPLLKIFGKHGQPNRREVQGGTINFEVLTPDGAYFPYKTVASELAATGFYARTGCMCNPGACYSSTGVREEEVRELALQANGNFSNWQWAPVDRENGTRVVLPLGSVRLSLGFMSRWEDAQAVAATLARLYRDRHAPG